MRNTLLLALALCPFAAFAQAPQTDWNAPLPAHRIMDNLYFVGTAQLGSFLITTSAGHILINSDFETTLPSLQRNVATRGFKFADETYNASIIGSFGVNDNYVLVGNKDYSNIAEDYVAMYAKVRALPVDVFLGSHGRFYGLDSKYALLAKRQAGDPNPFIDHAGYLAHIATQEQRFRAMLATQQAAAHTH